VRLPGRVVDGTYFEGAHKPTRDCCRELNTLGDLVGRKHHKAAKYGEVGSMNP
jgi:hypothetical protein